MLPDQLITRPPALFDLALPYPISPRHTSWLPWFFYCQGGFSKDIRFDCFSIAVALPCLWPDTKQLKKTLDKFFYWNQVRLNIQTSIIWALILWVRIHLKRKTENRSLQFQCLINNPMSLGVFDISISHIDYRCIDTFWKYRYRYGHSWKYRYRYR